MTAVNTSVGTVGSIMNWNDYATFQLGLPATMGMQCTMPKRHWQAGLGHRFKVMSERAAGENVVNPNNTVWWNAFPEDRWGLDRPKTGPHTKEMFDFYGKIRDSNYNPQTIFGTLNPTNRCGVVPANGNKVEQYLLDVVFENICPQNGAVLTHFGFSQNPNDTTFGNQNNINGQAVHHNVNDVFAFKMIIPPQLDGNDPRILLALLS